MRKSWINKVGKKGIANIQSRKMIANICESLGMDTCELNFAGCKNRLFLAPAHRHPRQWYNGDPETLADFKQWVVACVVCHEILDNRAKTSQKESDDQFIKLRGKE